MRLIRQSLDRHYQGELARVEDFNRRLIASVSISLLFYLCIYSRYKQIQSSSTVSGASTAEAGGTRSSRERSRSPLNQPRYGGSFRERSRSPPSQSTRLEHLTGLYGSRGSLYGYEYDIPPDLFAAAVMGSPRALYAHIGGITEPLSRSNSQRANGHVTSSTADSSVNGASHTGPLGPGPSTGDNQEGHEVDMW